MRDGSLRVKHSQVHIRLLIASASVCFRKTKNPDPQSFFPPNPNRKLLTHARNLVAAIVKNFWITTNRLERYTSFKKRKRL